jgi:hypothetical protein
MNLLWLAVMIGFPGFAIARAKGTTWKLLNFCIIVAFMGLGVGIGFASDVGDKSMSIGIESTRPLTTSLGIVGALACIQGNKRQAISKV